MTTALGHIGRGDKELVTAIVEAGLGKGLVERFAGEPGVLFATHHHARGVGSTRIKAGQMYFLERDVVLVLVERESADRVFRDLFEAGGIGRPAGGIIFSEPILRGHPLLSTEELHGAIPETPVDR